MQNGPVTLSEVLEARERRASKQSELIDRYSLPLISFTVVSPGSVKLTQTSKRLFSEGCAVLGRELDKAGLRVVYSEEKEYKTGCEALYCVDADEATLKKLAVGIEDGHPAGRLFDIDVISVGKVPVSRRELGLEERKCLLCGRPAHECARSRAHPVDELLCEIERIAQNG